MTSTNWKSKWNVKFTTPSDNKELDNEIKMPLGYAMNLDTQKSGQDMALEEEKKLALKTKVAWQVALSAGSSLPMNAFMMWMSGDQVGLWSIMMVGYMVWGPIQGVMAVNDRFKHLTNEDIDLTMQKLSFLMLNLLGLAMAAYKLRNLGLIPSTASDWLEYVENEPV